MELTKSAPTSEALLLGPGSDLKVSVGNLKLEDGRDAFFVGEYSFQSYISVSLK